MINKYIFNEDIKRVFNCIINNQIITQYILKDYISDFKIINDNKKKEKILENNSINLNNNNSKIIDSSSQRNPVPLMWQGPRIHSANQSARVQP